jgi:ribosome-binding protein aMBF1 (putative translation factor)
VKKDAIALARESAELAFKIQEMRYAEGWHNWPNMEVWEEGDVPPWWSAGVEYIHAMLPAAAEQDTQSAASRPHLQWALYKHIAELAEEVFESKLRRHHEACEGCKGWGLGDARRYFLRYAQERSHTLVDKLSSGAPAEDGSGRSGLPVADEPSPSFGSRLHTARMERGWSMDELANASGVRKCLIVGYEKHGKSAHPDTMKKLADALGLTVSELLAK